MRMPSKIGAPRINNNQGRVGASGILHKRCRNRMVVGRVGTNDDDHLGIRNVLHLIRHRTRPNPLKQRRDRRRMTQASTVIDIIGTKSGTYQLLEKIGLFIATFCGPESCQRRRSILLKHPL